MSTPAYLPPAPEGRSWFPRPHLCAENELLPCDCDGQWDEGRCPMCGDSGLYDPKPNFMDFWLSSVIWGQTGDDGICALAPAEIQEVFGDACTPSICLMFGKEMLDMTDEGEVRVLVPFPMEKHPELWWDTVQGWAGEQLRVMPYQEYLQTEHWRTVAQEAKERAGWRCAICNSKGPLHAHHRTYERRGNETEGDVIALCAPCHRKFHGIEG